MPKAKHQEHGQTKEIRLSARITLEGKQGLEDQALAMGISVAELLERLGRGQIQMTQPLGESLTS